MYRAWASSVGFRDSGPDRAHHGAPDVRAEGQAQNISSKRLDRGKVRMPSLVFDRMSTMASAVVDEDHDCRLDLIFLFETPIFCSTPSSTRKSSR